MTLFYRSFRGYSPECVEGLFSELRVCGIFRRLPGRGLPNRRLGNRVSRRPSNRDVGRRMDREPVVVEESAREWNTWPDEEVAEKGSIYWENPHQRRPHP